jgi:cell division septum initiation protein DivIVA
LDEDRKELLKQLDNLKKQIKEAEETIDILQRENDELRGEIMARDERNDLVVEEIGSKIDKLLDFLIERNKNEK